MSLVHPDRMTTLLGRYAVGGPDCLVDPSLVQVAQDYRRRAQARMQPLDPADLAKRLPPTEYHVSLKIDGEFNLLVYHDGEAILVNPGGTVRAGLPCVDRAAYRLRTHPYGGHGPLLLAGELWHLPPDCSRGRVHDVTRIARNPQTQADLERLRFAAFDVCQPLAPIGGPLLGIGKFRDAWNFLVPIVDTPPATWTTRIDEIQAYFKEWTDRAYEGIVLRSDQAGTFKVKPRHAIDAVVVGFTLDPDDQGRMHDLLVALIRPDGCYQVLGRVGGGFSEQDRRDWACDLKDWLLPSDYVETNEGVAYHVVRPLEVIEISCLDLIAQSTRGQPIQQACLELQCDPLFPSKAERWRFVRKLPLATMVSPQFVRRRPDKAPDATDVRLSQVTDLVEVPLAEIDARQFELPKSEMLKRGVWTKTLKGQTMVRKLVMYATHKHDAPASAGRAWPAFVIAVTDYSPNRAEPLERDVRVSDSREQIDELWDELVKEYVVKGWAREDRTAVRLAG